MPAAVLVKMPFNGKQTCLSLASKFDGHFGVSRATHSQRHVAKVEDHHCLNLP